MGSPARGPRMPSCARGVGGIWARVRPPWPGGSGPGGAARGRAGGREGATPGGAGREVGSVETRGSPRRGVAWRRRRHNARRGDLPGWWGTGRCRHRGVRPAQPGPGCECVSGAPRFRPDPPASGAPAGVHGEEGCDSWRTQRSCVDGPTVSRVSPKGALRGPSALPCAGAQRRGPCRRRPGVLREPRMCLPLEPRVPRVLRVPGLNFLGRWPRRQLVCRGPQEASPGQGRTAVSRARGDQATE